MALLIFIGDILVSGLAVLGLLASVGERAGKLVAQEVCDPLFVDGI